MKCCAVRIKHVTFQVLSDETSKKSVRETRLLEKTNALLRQNQKSECVNAVLSIVMFSSPVRPNQPEVYPSEPVAAYRSASAFFILLNLTPKYGRRHRAALNNPIYIAY